MHAIRSKTPTLQRWLVVKSLSLLFVLLCQHRPVFRPPRIGVVPIASGRPTRKEKTINQQYLNPQEEKVLTQEGLRMAGNDHPWRV